MPPGCASFGYTEDDIDTLVDGTLKQTRQLAVVPRPGHPRRPARHLLAVALSRQWHCGDSHPVVAGCATRRPAARSACTACTALSRATAIASRSEHPRDRSFIGAARPCNTGPIAAAPASRSVIL